MRAGAGDQDAVRKETTVASNLAETLNTERLRLHEQVKALNEKLGAEKRNAFTPDERTTWENLHSELDSVDVRLRGLLEDEKRAKETDESFANLATRPEHNVGSTKFDEEDPFTRRFRSFLDRDQNEVRSIEMPAWNNSRLANRLIENRTHGPANAFPGRGLTPCEARILFDNYVGGG